MKEDLNQRYCQSCAMPLGEGDDLLGSNADGSKNADYCRYCYQDGAFTADISMDAMIDFCAPMMAEHNPDMTQEAAKGMMREVFPRLKRWA